VLWGAAFVLAVITAARGAWSPCGLSMLSTLTPLAERSRGNRYVPTALWFVAGAVIGGTAIGALAALGALAISHVGLPLDARLALALAAALYAAASDLRVPGCSVPLRPRQVDERWVERYRVWIYAGGYGAQVGFGVATYVMSAGVYLLLAVCVLGANPSAAVGLCVVFGLTRGLCIFAGAGIDSAEALRAVHRRMAGLSEVSLLTCVAAELALGLAAATRLGLGAVVPALVLEAALVAWLVLHRRSAAAAKGAVA
jgi:hypothetical protein